MEERRHPWGTFVATFGISVLIARLCGWSWDKIWRHYAAWIVIVYAAIVGFGVVGDIWLSIYDHVPHVLLLGALVGVLALWTLRQRVQHPPQRRP
jgi:biotin transporter BioY